MAKEKTGKAQLQSMRDDLARLRDEIRVKAHLASMDMRDELARLQPEIDAFERRAEGTKADVGAELDEAWAHLKRALERVRDDLRRPAPH